MKKKILQEWLQIVVGLIVFAFGVHLTIYANIGLAPWDCLGMGISYHTPLNYGLSMTTIAVVILLVDLYLHERIGYGTIIDALLTGNFIQMFNDVNPLSENNYIWLGMIILFIGLVFMALGMWIYMKAAQCCGPRDSLLIGLGKRMSRLPIGAVAFILWFVILIIGWLLGGPVGVGTLLSTFGAGAVMQFIYNLLRFDPREIVHKDVIEVSRLLLRR